MASARIISSAGVGLSTVKKVVSAPRNKVIIRCDWPIRDVKNSPCRLAPSFGQLKAGSDSKRMDELLEREILWTAQKLSWMINDRPVITKEKNMNQVVQWNEIIQEMACNCDLKPMHENHASGPEMTVGRNFLKLHRSLDAKTVRETWLSELLLDDKDVLNCSTILTVENITALISRIRNNKKHHEEQVLMDIGILRYPHIDRPYFKVYHIHLAAVRCKDRNQEHGIIGVYNTRKYKSSSRIMNGF